MSERPSEPHVSVIFLMEKSPFTAPSPSGPHGSRDRGPSAVRRQTTAAQRDGRRLLPLPLGLARLPAGERLIVCHVVGPFAFICVYLVVPDDELSSSPSRVRSL